MPKTAKIKNSSLYFIAALILILSSCSNNRAEYLNAVDLEKWAAKHPIPFYLDKCSGSINTQITHIPSPGNYGMLYSRSIRLENLDQWLENTYTGRSKTKMVKFDLHIDVKKIYINSTGPSIIGNIAFSYQFLSKEKILSEGVITGKRLNTYASADDRAVFDSLNGALQDATSKLSDELNKSCLG